MNSPGASRGEVLAVSRPILLAAAIAALILAVLTYETAYTAHRFTPQSLESASSWRSWFDQSKYLDSAAAFAAVDLGRERHVYPIGYPLMAAPFVAGHPLNPFYPVNLVCFVSLAAALVVLGMRLGLGPVAGVLALILGVVWPQDLFQQYLVPWTTTPVAALYVISLSVYAKSLDEGLNNVRAMVLGAALVLVTATRPVDSIALTPLFVHLLWREWHRGERRSGWLGRLLSPPLVAGTVATALVLGAYLALHIAVHGVRPGSYIGTVSENILRPDLIPIRFLLLFNNPREIYGEGIGILEKYPATALGLIGLVYAALFLRYRGIALVVVLSLAVYLSYTELLPTGLWRFGNIHYLKWVFPVLVLLALATIRDVVMNRRWRRAFAVCALVIPLCLVGVGARSHPGTIVESNDGMSLLIRVPGERPIIALRFSEAQGDIDDGFTRVHRLQLDQQVLRSIWDFKAVPTGSGATIVLHKPRPFTNARFVSADQPRIWVGGRLEAIEPVLSFKNPFR